MAFLSFHPSIYLYLTAQAHLPLNNSWKILHMLLRLFLLCLLFIIEGFIWKTEISEKYACLDMEGVWLVIQKID